MNGETYQLCRLTAEVKMAMRENRGLVFEPIKYENCIKFQFMQHKTLSGTKAECADNPADWFEKLKKQGLEDIKMIIPTKVKNRQILGFANTNRASMFTFLKNGDVHYWVAQWDYDREIEMWNITYTEYELNAAPPGRPAFTDNTEAFVDILGEISDFADTIGFEVFGKIFREAIAIAEGKQEPVFGDKKVVIPRPPLPKTHEKIFFAASRADVFGAMGSWNDSPPYAAHKRGLTDEYDRLSDALLTQMRMAILYAVNEW